MTAVKDSEQKVYEIILWGSEDSTHIFIHLTPAEVQIIQQIAELTIVVHDKYAPTLEIREKTNVIKQDAHIYGANLDSTAASLVPSTAVTPNWRQREHLINILQEFNCPDTVSTADAIIANTRIVNLIRAEKE